MRTATQDTGGCENNGRDRSVPSTLTGEGVVRLSLSKILGVTTPATICRLSAFCVDNFESRRVIDGPS